MPRLGEANFQGVYVKLGDRDPISLIRKALAAPEGEAFVPMLENAVSRAGKPIVLILDQFEQFFVQFQETERAAFIDALKAWYESDVTVKVLIGIRGDLSDRLVEIQKALGYSLRPTQVYRLEKFAPEQATSVLRVIAETEGLAFNQQFVLEVARDELAGPDGKVSPVDVQILAQMISREANEENRTFDKQAFQKLGGVDGLLGRSLKRSLDTILSKAERERTLEVLLALTDLERNVRAGQFSLAQLQKLPGKIRGGQLEVVSVVQWLMDARLITPVEQEGNIAYELAHERLIPALRQVANQELSAVNRANMLLDSRVNQWLGSGKQRRYLFSLGELRLLRKQQEFLIWGQQQAQKKELLKRSWKPVRRKLVWIGTPLFISSFFVIWLNTYLGQIQSARWGIYNGYISDSNPNLLEEQNIAVILDMVAEVKHNPLPRMWLKLFAPTEKLSSSNRDFATSFSKLIGIAIEKNKSQNEGKELFNQIVTVVENLEDSPGKIPIITEISRAHFTLKDEEKVKAGLEQAIKISDSIESERGKIEALKEILDACIDVKEIEKAKQIISKELELVNSIKDNFPRNSSLLQIADGYVKLNDIDSAKKIILRVRETEKLDQSEFQKVNDLNAIAQLNMRFGDVKSAKKILLEAIDIVNTVPQLPAHQQRLKAESLGRIADSSTNLENPAEIKLILLQTVRAAKLIQSSPEQSLALGRIASASSKLNDSDESREVIFQVLDIVKSLQNEDSKASVLGVVSNASAQINNVEKAKKSIAKSIEIAHSIQYKPAKIRALISISKAYIKLDDAENAKKMLSQALEIAQSIQQEKSDQARAFAQIARSASQLNDVDNAQRILSKVSDIIKIEESKEREIELSSYKIARIAVGAGNARVYMKMNDIGKAKIVLSDASRISGNTTYFDTHFGIGSTFDDDPICQIAQIHAEFGNLGEALRLSEKCSSDGKPVVFIKILRVHAEQRNPGFKALQEAKSDEAKGE
jgi:tetratricopeptide (TPR) repeat protein